MSVCISTAASRGESTSLDAVDPIRIDPIVSRSDYSEFVKLPKRMFRHDACWIDPLDLEVKRFLSARHPFRLHGEAAAFLARKAGRVVGRILVSDDPRYNEQHASNVGCFGMFHSLPDQKIADQLLDAASHWLLARGRTELIGPIDYSTNYATGLLVEGFETPPSVLMNHHPPYYAELLQNWGLKKVKDLYAWWFTRANSIDQTWRERVDRLAARFHVVIRPIDVKNPDVEIERFRTVYNEAWQDNWGFVKMTNAEFRDLAHGLKRMAVPEMVLLAEVNDQPVGLAITIPNLNEAIAPLGGRLTYFGLPVGLTRLLWRLRKVKTARLAALGVVPRYRRRGVAEMLIQRTFDYGKDVLGYTGAELSWTLEDNGLINRSIERVGGRRYKTYRIYSKPLL